MKNQNPLSQTYPISLKMTTNLPTPSYDERFLNAIDIVISSLVTPDARLRAEAKQLDCYPELLTVRQMVVDHLQDLRENARLD